MPVINNGLRISELDPIVTPQGVSILPIVDSGVTQFIELQDISSFVGNNLSLSLSDLNNVNQDTPTNRNVLVADGSLWDSRPLVEADISDLQNYELLSNKGIANGYAPLDGSAQVPLANLPSILSFGANNQIPYTNISGTDFDYSVNLQFDDNTNQLLVIGNVSITGDLISTGGDLVLGATSVIDTSGVPQSGLNPPALVTASSDDKLFIFDTSNADNPRHILVSDVINYGGNNQIPTTNSTSDEFDYSSGFSYDGSRLIALGDGGSSTSIGNSNTDANFSNCLAIGANAVANTTRSGMIALSSTTQANSVMNSLEVNINGQTSFKVGNTYGTQLLIDADPDTNLTDAVDGCLAYDSTDDDVRALINGSWTSLVPASSSTSAGTYTPSITNTTNIDSVSVFGFTYMRVDDIVTVSGKMFIDPTATTTLTSFEISLPVSSNLANNYDLNGLVGIEDISPDRLIIMVDGETTNNTAYMEFNSFGSSVFETNIQFTYQVI